MEKLYKITCIVCGKIFEHIRPQYKKCSIECRLKHRKKYNKDWQDNNKVHVRNYVNDKNEENLDIRRNRNRKGTLRIYNMTEEAYVNKLKEQEGHCALCDTFEKLHIDHDHKCCDTRKNQKTCGLCTRGLLCGVCNRRLGYVERDLKESSIFQPISGTWLERALKYVKDYDIVRASR